MEMKTKEELDLERQELLIKYGSGNVFDLVVDDKKGGFITLFIKDLDQETYTYTTALYNKDAIQGMTFCIDKLWIGGDDKKIVTGNWRYVKQCEGSLWTLFDFQGSELKKN